MSFNQETSFGLSGSEIKRRHLLLKALLVGLATGLLASGFRVALAQCETTRIHWLEQASLGWRIAGALGFAILGGGISVWLVRKFAPEAAGSGIPHLKSFVLGEKNLNWRRLLPVKFLAGIAGIGGGLALGREGPTIQMGGSTGLAVAEFLRVPPGQGERKALISAGAGAGLAAAFNAPLAGMIFVLEELQGNFTPVIFIAAFLASVSADIVGRVLTGELPVFHLRDMAAPTLSTLPLAAVLGLVVGFSGIIFNRGLLLGLDLFERAKRWPPFITGALAGLCLGAAACFTPVVSGSGGLLAEQALRGEIAVRWLPLFIILRFFLTMVSYGSGAAGGIFAPLLVLGALGGLLVGNLGNMLAPTAIPHPEIFAVLGMGALFTSTVRAPLTGIVLMVELTGQYSFMLPLLTACLIAYGVAEWRQCLPIYEALRLRSQSVSTHSAGN